MKNECFFIYFLIKLDPVVDAIDGDFFTKNMSHLVGIKRDLL